MFEAELEIEEPEEDARRADQRADARRSSGLGAGTVGKVSGMGTVAPGVSAEEGPRTLGEREETSYVNRDAVNMLVIVECFRGINDAPLTFARIMFRTGFSRDQVRRLVISGKARGWIKENATSKERQFVPGPKAVNWARDLIASELRGGSAIQNRER